MNKQKVYEIITRVGIVPVVRAPSPQQARFAVDAICEGGIPIVEITMTVPGAIEVIRDLARSVGSHVLIGAGTVLDCETAKRCLDAGAQFLMTPGIDQPTIQLARSQKITIAPGALTPTEIMMALRLGADLIKIFPCGEIGGPGYIKALRGPFPDVAMVPTGGVTLETASDFLRAGAVAVGVGGELVSAQALATKASRVITANARRFVEIVQRTRLELQENQSGSVKAGTGTPA